MRILMMAGLLSSVGIIALAVLGRPGKPKEVEAPSAEWSAYYLPREEQCTVMVDFSAMRATLDEFSGPERASCLAHHLIEEFHRDGAHKSGDAKTIHLLAVYIQSKDNYGRPDFANRMNLLKLSGTREDVVSMWTADCRDLEQVKTRLNVEQY